MSLIAFLQEELPELANGQSDSVPPHAAMVEALFTEIVDLDQMILFRPAWADLVTRALEPNVFLEPAFAIPLFQHCQNQKKLGFLLTWVQAATDPRHELIGLLPLALPLRSFSCFARGVAHPQAPLGTPLFDRDEGQKALRHMAVWMRDHHPRLRGLMLSHLPCQGPVFTLIETHATAMHGKLSLFNMHERAALKKTAEAGAFPNGFISTKRRNNYRQQRRQLSRTGEVTYQTVSSPADVSRAAEAFLSLELKGWKGERKTALLATSSGAAFFRAMTRALASEGKCRIDSLELADIPIAMGVALKSGASGYFWKTAYDEQFARFSPGVQLTLELTQAQLAQTDITSTDSCAVSNHPMIDHIWRDRISIANVLIPLNARPGVTFRLGVSQEQAYLWLRGTAKSMLRRLLRRRH